jgi:hypothetical protein
MQITTKAALPYRFSLVLISVIALCASCGGRKKEPQPVNQTASYDVAGQWQSDIEGADRVITKSVYDIAQKADSVSVRLVSTISPRGDELVPVRMWFEAKGAWQNGALRLLASSWVSGKDTCAFQLKGEIDNEGRLLLRFPGDLCGEKSLSFTRTLYRPEQESE